MTLDWERFQISAVWLLTHIYFLRRQICSFNVYDLMWPRQEPCEAGRAQGFTPILHMKMMISREGTWLAKITLVSSRVGTWTQVSRLIVSGCIQEPVFLLSAAGWIMALMEVWVVAAVPKAMHYFSATHTRYASLGLLGQSGMISL